MMHKTLKKGTAIALSGMMILSGMSLVYADSQTGVKSTLQNQTSTSTTKSQHQFKDRMGDMKPGNFKGGDMKGVRTNPMDALIKDGTLTQADADALKTALDAARESKTTFADVLKNLVSAGTLTQEKADAITKSMPTPPAKDFNDRVNPMTTLVTAGTLTQTDADAVKAALDAARESKTTFTDVLKNLVSAGTLTQEKADAITKSMPAPPAKDMNGRTNPMTSLVTAGTLTQTQADAVQAALKAAHDSKTSPADVLKNLVTDGTLTQAQADALTTAMTPHHH